MAGVENLVGAPVADLRPLHLDRGRSVDTVLRLDGSLTFDQDAQVSLLDGRPLALTPMAVSKSTYSSDGKDAIAVDEGADDA